VIYLDSSALVKLVVAERESDGLESWVAARNHTRVIGSDVARVEVVRAARRVDADAVAAARDLLSGVDLIRVSAELLDLAADLGEVTLRTLDAIHLATALSLGTDLETFVAYDHRLLVAARAAGLPTAAPA
jgi:predicted nucleic acid-binding protein